MGFLVPLAVIAAVVAVPAVAGAPSWFVGLAGYVAAGMLLGTLVSWMPHEAAHAFAARPRGIRPVALVATRSLLGVEFTEEFAPWSRRARAPVLLAGPATDLALLVLLSSAAWLAATRTSLQMGMVLFGTAISVAIPMLANLAPMPETDMGKLIDAASRRR